MISILARIFILLTVLFCGMQAFLSAQNQHFVSGSISYAPEDGDFDNNVFGAHTILTFEPIYGRIISERLTVGIGPMFRYSTQSFLLTPSDTTIAPFTIEEDFFNIDISPFVRLKKEVSERFKLFAQVQLNVLQNRNAFFATNMTFELDVIPGFEYHLSPKWFLSSQATLASILVSYNDNSGNLSHRLALGMNGNSISLGINYRFGKDKSKKRVE